MNKVKIGVFRTDNGLESALREALKAADWDKHVRGKVFIKPNLCSPQYIPGAVTNPQVLFHLVSLLRDRAEEVVVGESNGYNYCCNDALKMTGVKKIVEKAGGKTINLSEDETVKVQNPKTFCLKNFSLPKTLVEAGFEYVTDMDSHKLFRKRKTSYLGSESFHGGPWSSLD